MNFAQQQAQVQISSTPDAADNKVCQPELETRKGAAPTAPFFYPGTQSGAREAGPDLPGSANMGDVPLINWRQIPITLITEWL